MYLHLFKNKALRNKKRDRERERRGEREREYTLENGNNTFKHVFVYNFYS